MLFISYSRKDQSIAQNLHKFMMEHGYRSEQVFKDDDARNGIVIGQDWEKQLVQNLRGTRALIVLVSPAWLKSKWCFTELAFAKSSPHKPAIIPFVIRELSNKQWAKSGLDRFQKSKYAAIHAIKLEDDIKSFVERELIPFYPPDSPLQRLRESHPNASQFKHKSFDTWGLDPNMQVPLVLGADQESMMKALESALAQPSVQHIHVIGESGTGKTRIVFEVLKESRFRELVIYFDSPTTLWSDPYFRELLSLDLTDKAVVVVDDCLRREHEIIANQVAKVRDRVRLVSISYLDDSTLPGDWQTVELKPLQTESISKIIGSYLHPTADVSAYATMCNGSPRFAHLVGESLSRETSILTLPNERAIVERIIACGQEINSDQVRTRLIVARFLSVFDRFGINPPNDDEVKSISRFIRHFHPGIGLGDLLDAIKILRERRILQGKSTLYFSTPLLSLQLWRQWWTLYGNQFKLRHLKKFPIYLQNGLAVMLQKVPEDDSVREIAECLLKDPGFRDPNIMSSKSNFGRRLLHAVSDLCPNQTVEILWQCWTCWDRSNPDQRDFYSALGEFMRECFVQAQSKLDYFAGIRLLEALAVEELADKRTAKEYLGNIFCIDSEKRESGFPYAHLLRHLKQMVDNGGPESQSVAVDICKSAIVQTTVQSPPTKRYIDDIWKIMSDTVFNFPENDSKLDLIDIIGVSLQGLFLHPSSHSRRLALLDWLTNSTAPTRLRLLHLIESYWNQPRLHDPVVRQSLQAFYRRLIGTDLHGRVATLPEVLERWKSGFVDPPQLIDHDAEIEKLARDLTASGNEASQMLVSLVSSDAGQSLKSIGQAIARADTNSITLNLIVQALNTLGANANPQLLAGYLAQLRETNLTLHDSTLEEVIQKLEHYDLTLRLVVQSQPGGERTISQVSELLLNKGAHPSGLVGLGPDWFGAVDASQIHAWVRCCLDRNELSSLNTACVILTRRFPESNFDEESTKLIREIIESDLIRSADGTRSDSKVPLHYFWRALFEWLAKVDLEACCGLASRYWKAVSTDQVRVSYVRRSEEEHATEFLVESNAPQVWITFFEVMNAADRKGAQRLMRWLARTKHNLDIDGSGYWDRVPLNLLFEWIDHSPSERIQDVCHCLPPLIVADGVCEPTREFLIRYWEQDTSCWDKVSGVRPGSWAGKLSDYYRKRIGWIVEAQGKETNPIVATWLQSLLANYGNELERSQETEEQEAERNVQ